MPATPLAARCFHRTRAGTASRKRSQHHAWSSSLATTPTRYWQLPQDLGVKGAPLRNAELRGQRQKMSTLHIAGHVLGRPTVSVVVPTYNEAENVPVLVRRIIQVMPDAEIVVVDDGSPDG